MSTKTRNAYVAARKTMQDCKELAYDAQIEAVRAIGRKMALSPNGGGYHMERLAVLTPALPENIDKLGELRHEVMGMHAIAKRRKDEQDIAGDLFTFAHQLQGVIDAMEEYSSAADDHSRSAF